MIFATQQLLWRQSRKRRIRKGGKLLNGDLGKRGSKMGLSRMGDANP